MAEQRNAKLSGPSTQPYGVPLKGSKKVKNHNHSRQKKGASHDL